MKYHPNAEASARIFRLLERVEVLEVGPCPGPCKCLVYHPTCGRCERVASVAEKHGDPLPHVDLAETWIAPNGVRVFAATCWDCTNIEWSRRWDLAYEAARGREGAMSDLLERCKRWEASGRIYVGTKRPGGATATHTAACRCRKCRDEHSLIPPEYSRQAS